MKELSIEDKAKRYDETIKKAESLYKVSEPMSECNVIIETLFPELKENEDDEIRKAIKSVISYNVGGNKIYGFTKEKMIAWLEKQGQKPAWSENDETYLNTIVSDLYYSKAIHNKAKCNFIDKEIKWFKSLKNRVQPQPKQEWSEEDKEMYKKIETAIDSYYAPFSRDAEEMSEWFKNLKYRVQPKQEWSEEDEEIHRKCICAMRASACGFSEEEKFVEQVDNWLKSLKDRVQPM